MKNLLRFGIAAATTLAVGSSLHAATYSIGSVGSFSWSNTSTWTVSGTTPSTVPGIGDSISTNGVGAGGVTLNIDGGNRTVANLEHYAGGNSFILSGSGGAGGNLLNITGTLSKSSANTFTIRSNTLTNNPMGFTANVVSINGGGNTIIGSGSLLGLTSFSATTMRIFAATNARVIIGRITSGTVAIQNLTVDTGALSIYGGNSLGGTQTMLVNSLSGTGGLIGTGNDGGTNNVSTGILAINSTGTSTFAGQLADITGTAGAGTTATLAVLKTGSGMQVLAGANTYTGGTTINDGVLQFGSGGTTGSIVGNVATGSSSAVLAFNRSDAYTFGGSISGSGQVSQVGTGTTTLTANNTYTGTTNVSAGTLLLSAASNNIANSAVIHVGSAGTLNVASVSGGFTLASGQALTGDGTVTGAITIGNGASLAIGNSPGTMTFNNDLTLAAGSTSNFEINGLTTGLYDLAQGGAGAQAVAFDGTLNLVFQGGFATNGTVKIFDFESYSGSFSAVNTSGLAAGYTASFNALTGEVTVVPEPGTCALLALGLGALLWRARNRRRG